MSYKNLLLVYNKGFGEYGDVIHYNIILVLCKENNVRIYSPEVNAVNWYIRNEEMKLYGNQI